MTCISMRFFAEPRQMQIYNRFQSLGPNFLVRRLKERVFSTSKYVLIDHEQQKHLNKPKLAERLVESSPKQIQPYLKLMRMDRPIGEPLFSIFFTIKQKYITVIKLLAFIIVFQVHLTVYSLDQI